MRGGWYNDRRRPMPVPTHPPTNAQPDAQYRVARDLKTQMPWKVLSRGWILNIQQPPQMLEHLFIINSHSTAQNIQCGLKDIISGTALNNIPV